LKCPNCGTEIIITEVSFDCYDGNCYEYFTGRCPDCDNYWEWCDIYEFTESTIPTLIEDNDHL
jgi:hypothetical protein